MSQSSNKVQWCLNKAKKELIETGMHRGLVEQIPDDKLARMHITKAEHNLSAALFFQNNGYSDWSASAFFYSIYHCFLAILRKFGYESRNQECTIATIEMLNELGKTNIDNKFVNTLKINKSKEDTFSIIRIREDFQYGTNTDFTEKEEFERLKDMCKEILAVTKEIVYKN
jgi:uncharacterized protein (UPF0332 family)